MIKRLALAIGLSALGFAANAATLNPLGSVTVTTPGSGQAAQNFYFSCAVSGCATGVAEPAMELTQGNALLGATNGLFANLLQGNAVISATNGLYANLLQGNAVLSLTNPAFNKLTDGTTAMSIKAASTAAVATDPSIVVAISPNSPATVAQATAANLKAQVSAASGGYASGSLAAGAGTDGWDVTEGTKADTAWVSGSGSVVSLLKTIASAGASSSITGWAGSTIGTGTIQAFGATEGTIGSGLVPASNVHVTNTNANDVHATALSSPVVEAVSAATALQTAAVANGNGTPLTVSGYNGAMVYVNCTVACSGGTTVNFEGSIDATNFVSIQGQALSTGTPATTATTTGGFAFNTTGLQSIRARISGYSAGTLTVTAVAGSAPAMQSSVSSGSSAITSWGGGTLGAMSNFGTTPTAVLVPGMNASLFIGTTAASAGHGTAAAALRVELPTDGTGVVGLNAGTNLIGKAGIDQTTVGTTNGVSLAQIGATTISAGTGAVGTGSQRVAVGTDTATIAGSSPTGALSLAANQSVNTAQVNGVTTLTGTGAVGTGAQRIAVGTDTATVAGSSPTATISLALHQSTNIDQIAGSSSGIVAVSTAPTTAGNVAQVMDLRPDSPGIIALGANTAALSVPMVPATDKVQGTPSSAVTGSYCMSSTSGTMAAGLAANAPIFSLRYAGSGVALVRRVRFSANDGGTAFTAGTVQFQLFAARSYSVADTGGAASTLTGNNGKLRTSFATTSMADFRTSSTATLTAGTRTLDATPLGSWDTSVPATIATPIIGPVPLDLVRPESGEQPVQLATSEGLVLQATVPATGVWVFAMQVCWDEVAAY